MRLGYLRQCGHQTRAALLRVGPPLRTFPGAETLFWETPIDPQGPAEMAALASKIQTEV